MKNVIGLILDSMHNLLVLILICVCSASKIWIIKKKAKILNRNPNIFGLRLKYITNGCNKGSFFQRRFIYSLGCGTGSNCSKRFFVVKKAILQPKNLRPFNQDPHGAVKYATNGDTFCYKTHSYNSNNIVLKE